MMKIRIKGNTVRYRLTRTEVKIFCETGHFEEKTQFRDETFIYELRTKAGLEHLDANFKENTITLYLPEKERERWGDSEQVGFQHTIVSASGAELSLLLEKDFTCLDETIEDQSDNYPNPLANK